MKAFYNEIDPFAADWLEALIAAGLICPGVVDRRNIRDILPSDLDGFTQAHFFAGIGGWSCALRLAGWPDDRPVWTGSCPCQPFSAAGRGGGFADERHLWPSFFHLIGERRPPVVFGEQVASKDGLEWFDLVHADLEGAGYAVGAADLCAAGVGAPHIRQRLWFVADAACERPREAWRLRCEQPSQRSAGGSEEFVADANNQHAQGRKRSSDDAYVRQEPDERQTGLCSIGELDDSERFGRPTRRHDNRSHVRLVIDAASQWSDLEWLPCRDGKARPTKSGIQPLAHGVSNRVGTLRGAGNAIVAQVAAQVIGAFMEARS